MELACQLTSSWPPARAEERVWAALLGEDLANLPNPANLANLGEFDSTHVILTSGARK